MTKMKDMVIKNKRKKIKRITVEIHQMKIIIKNHKSLSRKRRETRVEMNHQMTKVILQKKMVPKIYCKKVEKIPTQIFKAAKMT